MYRIILIYDTIEKPTCCLLFPVVLMTGRIVNSKPIPDQTKQGLYYDTSQYGAEMEQSRNFDNCEVVRAIQRLPR